MEKKSIMDHPKLILLLSIPIAGLIIIVSLLITNELLKLFGSSLGLAILFMTITMIVLSLIWTVIIFLVNKKMKVG